MEMLKETSSSSSGGFEQEVTISAGVEIGDDATGKASVGAETTQRTSLMVGNSDLERESKELLEDKFTYQMSNKARAEIFELRVNGHSQTTDDFKR